MVTIDAILLGAGLGRRFSESATVKDSSLPKQFQMLGNQPVFAHAMNSLLGMGGIRQIVFVVPKTYLALAKEQVASYIPAALHDSIRIISGGERRQDSSRLALEALEEINPLATRVLIHDACRPYLSPELLATAKNCLLDRSYGAWVPVVPVVDTLKKIENHQVIETVDRNLVHHVQTPQIFEYTVVRSLMEKVKEIPELNFTDDASLCEYFGIPVGVFEGDVRNIKLTYDFEKATLLSMLGQQESSIVGTSSIGNQAASCEQASDTTFTV